jgi:hypothetical protein
MSSTSENKRNIMYALGAGAAVLGAIKGGRRVTGLATAVKQ